MERTEYSERLEGARVKIEVMNGGEAVRKERREKNEKNKEERKEYHKNGGEVEREERRKEGNKKEKGE